MVIQVLGAYDNTLFMRQRQTPCKNNFTMIQASTVWAHSSLGVNFWLEGNIHDHTTTRERGHNPISKRGDLGQIGQSTNEAGSFTPRAIFSIPQEGRLTAHMKDPNSGTKPHNRTSRLWRSAQPRGRNIKFKNYIPWVWALHMWTNHERQERENPNTTSRMAPPGVRAASMIGQGRKEHLKGSLTASWPPETKERREERRVK